MRAFQTLNRNENRTKYVIKKQTKKTPIVRRRNDVSQGFSNVATNRWRRAEPDGTNESLTSIGRKELFGYRKTEDGEADALIVCDPYVHCVGEFVIGSRTDFPHTGHRANGGGASLEFVWRGNDNGNSRLA